MLTVYNENRWIEMEGKHSFNKSFTKTCEIQNELTTKNFRMISDIKPEPQEIYKLEKKEHTISVSYFFCERYQRRNLIHYVMIQSINVK